MRMPVLFQAHGAPMLLDDATWVAQLAAWAKALPKPRSILVISAHWEQRPMALSASVPLPLIYDFYGFPEKFYQLQYRAPGAPELAARVKALLPQAVSDEGRGLDHGTYIPLMCMYPQADIPVIQLSLPSMDPKELYAIGQALAPLRDEGTLIVGSGFLTHNLRAMRQGGIPAWARDFDAWTADVIGKGEVGALLDYKTKGPGVRDALPTHEHFVPVIVSVGAAGDDQRAFPITGFWFDGPMTKRSVQFG